MGVRTRGVRRGAVATVMAVVATTCPSLFPTLVRVASAAPAPTTIELTAVADTFVSAQLPDQNFGSIDSLDTYGGTNPECLGTLPGTSDVITAPAYALLKFDLAAIPPGATVTGASLKLTSRAGWAQDGDQNHHVVLLDNLFWSEDEVTWNTRPTDGTVAPGDPTLAATGQDIRASERALGSTSVFRATCAGDFQGDQLKEFPTNGYLGNTDQAQSRDDASRRFAAAVNDADNEETTTLSLEVYSPGNGPLGKSYWARYYSRESGPALAPKLVLTFASATVVQAVPTGAATQVSAKITGAPDTAYTVSFATAAQCADGRLETPVAIGALAATTDADGSAYVSGSVGAAAAFVNVTLSNGATGELSVPSPCVGAGPDNDTWTRALHIPLGGAPASGSAQGFVDTEGGARWFKFDIQPGAKVTVDLQNPTVDLDLALFSDIGQRFDTLSGTPDLLRLTAEFAPSVFSPSVFSPSVFSPSVFSPDAYSPSVFSPSVFSPSVFSPSVFSPSVFSPSVFSPSVFSPSVFSPSVFSPSVFSPSVFSPSVFSPAGVAPSVFSAEAFASAQTRSLLGSSATAGTGNESIVADTWNNSGSFYVRVSGRNGAFSTTAPFTLSVRRDDLAPCAGVSAVPGTPTTSGGGYRTVILLDSSRMPANQPGNSAADLAALQAKLATFAARPEVQGVVVDVAGDSRVATLNAQADGNRGCPYAKNLVADAIKDVVEAYRNVSPNLAYVVLVGPDGAIPFFRYPDRSLLGPESDYIPPMAADTSSEASLRLNYVLGQDEYGAATTLNINGSALPVPDLAVGRLIETAAEASGMIDAYSGLNGGVVPTPTSALVTGYDFLVDAADDVAAALSAGIGGAAGPGAAVDTLITPGNISPQDPRSWTATDLRGRLFNERNDLVYLAGHFSANSALAADFATSVLSTEVGSSGTDFTNTIVFSAGCHSGYNIDDRDAIPGVTETIDWVQAFAREQATVIGGTGYQYGDTDFLEYSERIYSEFAKELRYGTGAVSVGQALARAKQTYLQQTPDPRGLHGKALLQSALFGLPMLAVDMPAGRIPRPADSSIIGGTTTFGADPGATLRLASADTTISDPLSARTVPLDVIGTNSPTQINATYYVGPDGVVTNPGEPALPLVSKDVTVPGKVLRGVGFRGGNYTDIAPITPLTGAATTELRGVHAPFVSPVFYPMRLATPNYFGALGGGDTRLLVTPAQHRSIPGTNESTLRLYDNVDLRLYYSDYTDTSALSAAPSISGVTATVQGDDVVISANVTGNPAAGIQEVWTTYTGDDSRWTSVDLVQCVENPTLPADCTTPDSTRWVGRIVGGAASRPDLRFTVQAANGVGLVTLDDAFGAYYGVDDPDVFVPELVATTLTLEAPPTSAVYGSEVTVAARLVSGAGPLAGRSVVLTAGSATRQATTDADGVARATMPVIVVPGPSQVGASFPGDATQRSSSASAPLTVSKAPTAMSIEATTGPVGVTATLTDAGGGPLIQRTVYFVITGDSTSTVVPAITDYLGRATLSPIPAGPGTATITAKFLGAIPLPTPTVLTDLTYLESSASTSVTISTTADVGVSGTASATPTVGTPATFTFTITNAGPDSATGVTLAAPLPASLATATTPTPGCAITAGTLTCSLASLATGPGEPIVLIATPTAPGPLSITATVAAAGTDPRADNDNATVSITVAAPAPVADLRLGMTTLGLFTNLPSTYLFSVTNLSNVATAGPVTVTDELPVGLTYRGVVAIGWTCSAVLRTVTCTSRRALPARSITALAIVVNVTAARNTTITNTATLTPTDLNPGNNTATVTTRVRRL